MCRHVGYVGPPDSPTDALLDADHSLRVQAYAPVDMRGGGTINVDGFGIGWYSGETPRRYRRACPIWADETLPGLAGEVRTRAYLAAVRSGTPGMPVTEAACAPFTGDGWLFSHNGVVRGWPDSMTGLATGLPTADLLSMEAPTDSVLLWALLRARLRDGEKPLDAAAGLVGDVERAAPGSRLNLMLTDGETIVATAWRHALSLRESGDSVLVASEPVDDDPDWRPVPDGYAVFARSEATSLMKLDTKD